MLNEMPKEIQTLPRGEPGGALAWIGGVGNDADGFLYGDEADTGDGFHSGCRLLQHLFSPGRPIDRKGRDGLPLARSKVEPAVMKPATCIALSLPLCWS